MTNFEWCFLKILTCMPLRRRAGIRESLGESEPRSRDMATIAYTAFRGIPIYTSQISSAPTPGNMWVDAAYSAKFVVFARGAGPQPRLRRRYRVLLYHCYANDS